MMDARFSQGAAPIVAAARNSWWRTVEILLAVAVAARVRTFGNPIVFIDEEFYLLVARAMWRGALLYVDIWDRKPIGLFLIYLPAAPWSPQTGVYIYQAMALAAVVATAALIVRLAHIAGWRHGALVAGILYILWLDLADGQSGQSPVFYNLLMVWAIAIVAGGAPDHRRRGGVVAMALVGIALQIKYSVVFEGMWIGLWLMWDEHRITRSIGRAIGLGMVLGIVALVPTAVVALWYLAIGHGDAFVYANFQSILQRNPDPAAMQRENALVALELLGPLVAMTLIGIARAISTPGEPTARAFLYGWLAVSLLGFAIFGGWYNHYTLPVMVPACLCAAAFFSHSRVGRGFAVALIAMVFIAGQWIISSEARHRGSPADFAALVRAVGPGPGSLYVDMGNPALYSFTGRHAVSRYVFPSHLQIAREAGAIGVDQAAEIDRIFARRPDVVTLQGPDSGAAPERAAQVRALVAHGGYAPPQHLIFGTQWIDIYRRADLKTRSPSPVAR